MKRFDITASIPVDEIHWVSDDCAALRHGDIVATLTRDGDDWTMHSKGPNDGMWQEDAVSSTDDIAQALWYEAPR